MIDNNFHIFVGAPIEEMIPALTDSALLRQWYPGFVSIKQSSAETLSLGTTFQQVIRVGRTRLRFAVKVTQFDPPRKISFRLDSKAFHMQGNWTFNMVLKGTEIYYTEKVIINSWIFKIFKSLIRNYLRKRNGQLMIRFKQYMDTRFKKRSKPNGSGTSLWSKAA